jgi:putative ABC transport system substrate-binding protein
MGGDPVQLGIAASLNRLGGNITGVSFLVNGLAGKEIELLHDLVPKRYSGADGTAQKSR